MTVPSDEGLEAAVDDRLSFRRFAGIPLAESVPDHSSVWRFREEPVEALPVVGQEDVALDADLAEKSPAGRIITPTQLPGQGSPCHRESFA